MLIIDRQNRLKSLLAARGTATLDALASELQVSQSTVRRDVELLEQAGLVERTHGGVVWAGERPTAAVASGRPYAFDQRTEYRADEKVRIARAAATLVRPGQTVLVDGGTTTYYLARELVGRPMQLVTNSLPIGNLFVNDDNVELILTGGLVYPRYGVLLGPHVEAFLGTVHASTLFLSCAGVRDGAVYNQNLLLVQAEQQMMRQVQQVVLLADSTKFGQQALAKLCDLSQVHVVVTDAGIDPEQADAVRAAGCELVLATDEHR
ncbi:MAG: transcriptional regulator, DeoR family [Phycisphaerales bacterium]|nr:transcriptional regulator, DeoR family [Phycisphaerales bacterium]